MGTGAVIAAAAAAKRRRTNVILDAFRLADATAPDRAFRQRLIIRANSCHIPVTSLS